MTEFRHARRSVPDPGSGPARRDDGDADGAAAAVVAGAVRRLQANGHLYFELEPVGSARIAVAVRHHRPEDTALGEYGDQFYADDPLTASFRDRLLGGDAAAQGAAVVALGELPAPLRRSYENRFGRRAGIADVLGLGVPARIAGRPRMLCFGFHRGASDPGFDAGEKRVLARLADGLRLRAENLALREALALQATIGRALAEDTGSGWALLDDRLQVRQAGGSPRAFHATGGVEGAAGILRARLGAGSSTGGADGPVAVRTGPEGCGLVAEPLSVAGGERWWFVRSGCGPLGAGPVSVAAAAGLTGREREVAGLLMAGRGNRELARDLGLTVNTVENHLRSIYGKLGVRSRGQATARLLGVDPHPDPRR